MKKAIVTGINGQDGFHLTCILLNLGYQVIGIQRRASTMTDWRLKEIPNKTNLILEAGDVTDFSSIIRLVQKYQPDEFYNLAAQSQVWHSFKAPLSTVEITGLGAFVCLEAVRQAASNCRFYQASSSEMFGNSAICGATKPVEGVVFERVLDETSPMIPRSPYGAAKLFAHNMIRNYREAYGMFAVGGILFNHEGPYRGKEFLTRKITDGVARICSGKQASITLGNLDSYRDWGHANDYMVAAHMMLQQDIPSDYVIATGCTYSVEDFLNLAWMCVNKDDWESLVVQSPDLMRPSEVDVLIGDASRAKKELGWVPQYDFVDLVYEMMEFDLKRQQGLGNLKPKEGVMKEWVQYLENKSKTTHNIIGR